MKRYFLLLLIFLLTFVPIFAAPSALETLLEKADFLFSQDYIESSLREAIALYEAALELSPDNSFILNRLSEAYYKLGYVHLFVLAEDPDSKSEEKLASYQKGFEYGIKSLELNPVFLAKKERDFPQALEAIDDIAALHWTACNLGAILSAVGISLRAFSELPKLRALLERALEVDREYLFGGPIRAMASYWAALPWWFGQNLEKARELFEESLEKFPDFLGNHALYIQEYLARVKNCPLLQEEVIFIRNSPIHQEYKIWDIASKIGIERFLETIDWCSI